LRAKVITDASSLLTIERSDEAADVLVVTNLWPREDKPAYGVFIERQVESLRRLDLRFDVLFVRGYRAQSAYAAAAARLAAWNARPPRAYRLVHAHGGEASLPARFYVRAPLVVSFCGDDLLGTVRPDGSVSMPRRLRRGVLRNHARLAQATITKSAEMASRLPESIRDRNHVIPNGVDFDIFQPMPMEDARRRLGWPSDEHVALFAADPSVPRKRFELAQAAVLEAQQRVQPLRLHVAANAAPDEMPLLMNASSCLVLTSTAEGSPNVVKEALACNLPVVSTDVGDVAQLLAGVEPSWIVAADAAAVASAIVACAESGRRSNGRERSDWLHADVIARRVLEVYRSVGYDP
jgi:glycosyltransferase involved in cell wall biosynthesis